MASRLGDRTAGRGVAKVLRVLGAQPRQVSYASTAEVSASAGVNAATVVRAAQLLGFSGWPALRSEIRSRYLSSLSASEVLSEHGTGGDGSAAAAVRRGTHNLQDLSLVLDQAQIDRVAGAIAGARVTLVLGSGSFAGPGLQLSHLAQTIGHDVRLHRTGGTSLFNEVSLLREGDCLIAFLLWRTPWQILHAMQAAPPGVRIVLVCDQTRDELVTLADEFVHVPSEGSSMFPSLVAPTVVVEATLAALVARDPDAAAAASDRAELLWSRYGLFPDPGEDLQ
ncbi:MurR/RpiR family transcriptional regulator [Ornithinimicrobium avium]|uniref:MurR/RpiR family transcriptional regulator n=2 Tax=Ornithinimicrobium avium TaxID=2283195 RepID=A0A345NN02_9MICO|nr:MurR/RpiR family transcriptional regulator [Ornithinimicrobium avium]